MLEYSDTWLRLWREEAGLAQGDLARRVRRSKVLVNQLERGRRQPSSATAQLITAELERELHLGLEVDDVFPDNGMSTPREAARMYLDIVREREGKDPLGEARRVAEAEGLSLDEWQLRRDELEAERRYEDVDPATWQPFSVELEDGTVVTEQPPRWFLARVHRAQKQGRREARPSRRRSHRSGDHRSTRGSPDDDPDEPEPARRGHGERSKP